MITRLDFEAVTPRREFLRSGAAAVAGALMPLRAEAADDFTFVVANDLHYRDARCGEWLGAVVASIRASRPRPAFVVLNGDLSDLGTRGELGAVKEIFRPLPMPVHAIIGNHDYEEDGSRKEYEALFGPKRNFHFRHAGWDFFGIDTTSGRGVFRTWVRGETLGWLDANLPRIGEGRPLVVFSHFPLALNWLRPLNAGDVTRRLRTKSAAAIFCGHWHGLSEKKEGGMPVSIGRCCSWWRGNHDGSNLKGYFLCRVNSRGIQHEFMPVAPPRGLLATA